MAPRKRAKARRPLGPTRITRRSGLGAAIPSPGSRSACPACRRALRPFHEQPTGGGRRHVTLNHVTIDLSGVAGGERLGHAEPDLDPVHLGALRHLHREAGGLQVLDPAAAAAAGRVPGDGHLREALACAEVASATAPAPANRARRLMAITVVMAVSLYSHPGLLATLVSSASEADVHALVYDDALGAEPG